MSDPKLMSEERLAWWSKQLAPTLGERELLSHIDAQDAKLADLDQMMREAIEHGADGWLLALKREKELDAQAQQIAELKARVEAERKYSTECMVEKNKHLNAIWERDAEIYGRKLAEQKFAALTAENADLTRHRDNLLEACTDADKRVAAHLELVVQYEDERDAARAECERLFDLVRYQRAELHEAGLITDAEYASLAAAKGSVQRLEGYDALKSECERLAKSVGPLSREVNERAIVNAEQAATIARLRECLTQMLDAMVRYEMHADTDAPQSHRKMMAAARAALERTP